MKFKQKIKLSLIHY